MVVWSLFVFMDWQSIDELIRRGELLLSLEFLENYDEELKAMNRGNLHQHYLHQHYETLTRDCPEPLRSSVLGFKCTD